MNWWVSSGGLPADMMVFSTSFCSSMSTLLQGDLIFWQDETRMVFSAGCSPFPSSSCLMGGQQLVDFADGSRSGSSSWRWVTSWQWSTSLTLSWPTHFTAAIPLLSTRCTQWVPHYTVFSWPRTCCLLPTCFLLPQGMKDFFWLLWFNYKSESNALLCDWSVISVIRSLWTLSDLLLTDMK